VKKRAAAFNRPSLQSDLGVGYCKQMGNRMQSSNTVREGVSNALLRRRVAAVNHASLFNPIASAVR